MAGQTGQGSNAIAIGNMAGQIDQHDNSIVINADSSPLDNTNVSGCFINPIREITSVSQLYKPLRYNTVSHEIVTAENGSGDADISIITDNFVVTGGSQEHIPNGNNTNLFHYSFDGLTWNTNETTLTKNTFSSGRCNKLHYNNKLHLAGGKGTNALCHSSNGIYWKSNNSVNSQRLLPNGTWRKPFDLSNNTFVGGIAFTNVNENNYNVSNRIVAGFPKGSTGGYLVIYNFSINGDTWIDNNNILYPENEDIPEQYIFTDSNFGMNVLISNDGKHIASGAPDFQNLIGTNTYKKGKVVVYTNTSNSNNWNDSTAIIKKYIQLPTSEYASSLSTLNLFTSSDDDLFGHSIAFFHNYTKMLIGSPGTDSNRGFVFIYDLNSTPPAFDTYYLSLSITTKKQFGYGIEINLDGTRCIITDGTENAYYYIFSSVDSKWGLEDTSNGQNRLPNQILPYESSLFTDASFGFSSTMNDNGDWCAIGAPNANGKGAVVIYSYNIQYDKWVINQYIFGNELTLVSGDQFGYSVKMNGSGNSLMISTNNINGIGEKSYAYTYNYSTTKRIWEIYRNPHNTMHDDITHNGIFRFHNYNFTDSPIDLKTIAVNKDFSRFVIGGNTIIDGSDKAILSIFHNEMECTSLTYNNNWIAGGKKSSNDIKNAPIIYSNDGINDWGNSTDISFSNLEIIREPILEEGENQFTDNFFGKQTALNAEGNRMAVVSHKKVESTELPGSIFIYDHLYDYTEGKFKWTLQSIIKVPNVYNTDSTPPINNPRGEGANNLNFGSSMKFNAIGDRLFVGDNNADVYLNDGTNTLGQRYGALYIYDYVKSVNDNDSIASSVIKHNTEINPGTYWKLSQHYVCNTPKPSTNTNTQNNLGAAIAVNAKGDRFAVSAPGIQVNDMIYSGSIFIVDYDVSSNCWPGGDSNQTITDILNHPVDIEEDAHHTVRFNGANHYMMGVFSTSVAFNALGDRIVIGCPVALGGNWIYTGEGGNGGNNYSGIISVIHYNYNENGWGKIAGTKTIVPADNTQCFVHRGFEWNDAAGVAVALNAVGDRLLWGAPMSPGSLGTGARRGYVHSETFDYTTNTWPHAGLLEAGVSARSYNTRPPHYGGTYYTPPGPTVSFVGDIDWGYVGFNVAFNAEGDIAIFSADVLRKNYESVIAIKLGTENTYYTKDNALWHSETYNNDGPAEAHGQLGSNLSINSDGTIIAAGGVFNYPQSPSFQAPHGNNGDQLNRTIGTTTSINAGYIGMIDVKNKTPSLTKCNTFESHSGIIIAGGITNSKLFMYSDDNGKTWNNELINDIQINKNKHVYCNALHSNTHTIIVAGLGGGGTTTINPLAYSYDGLTWYESENGSAGQIFNQHECYTINYNGSIWVAGGHGTHSLAYSYNGKKWYNGMNTSSLLGQICHSVTWNGKYWLACGGGSSAIAGVSQGEQIYSIDGIVWSESVNEANNVFNNNGAICLTTKSASNASDGSGGGGTTLSVINNIVQASVGDTMPELSVITYAGSTVPSGWQLCDGSVFTYTNDENVTISDSRVLNFNINSSSNRLTPDLRGRFILGSGQGVSLTNRNIHETGGTEEETLTEAQMPSHNHRQHIVKGNDLNWSSTYGGPYSVGTDDKFAQGYYGSYTDSKGSDQPHNNMPPFYVLTYIIKKLTKNE